MKKTKKHKNWDEIQQSIIGLRKVDTFQFTLPKELLGQEDIHITVEYVYCPDSGEISYVAWAGMEERVVFRGIVAYGNAEVPNDNNDNAYVIWLKIMEKLRASDDFLEHVESLIDLLKRFE